MNKPLLVVVTGCPGSGKTTLAQALAREIHCPVFCRDQFKEGYVNTTNGSHDTLGKNVNWQIYETFFQAVELMVAKQISLVIEAAFQHKLWAAKLESLRELTRLSILICTVDPFLARARFNERMLADLSRWRFHGDRIEPLDQAESKRLIDNYSPPRLSTPTLHVDTTEGYRPDIAEIVSFVMS
jgi:predicted kinase